ncbi:adenylate kinase 9-like [Daktulosphaira vitifoliae]|uniref:adenylate kinase 9-like n=1 Tax=Daktulosphaira vitifoliae TaxID=58002 RepID=UPI0021A9E5D1|nr:adenylate kinase 9-like [Daktulosphaira vitifoliae]
MDTIFSINPPNILIYLSINNDDIDNYYLKIEKKTIKRKLFKENEFSHHNIHLNIEKNDMFNNSFPNKKFIDTYNYEKFTLNAVEETIKRFDPQYVITLDGRQPVQDIFKTVEIKLRTLPLHRIVHPKMIQNDNIPICRSISITDRYEIDIIDDNNAESVLFGTGTLLSDSLNSINESNKNSSDQYLRKISDYGKLCPVSLYNGNLVNGSDHYTIEFLGKLYFFVGIYEMNLFYKFPRQFLEIPRPNIPVKAIFYGPSILVDPLAKATCEFFKFKLININSIKQTYEQNSQKIFIATIVDAIKTITKEHVKSKIEQRNKVKNIQKAIGRWMHLYFGVKFNKQNYYREVNLNVYEEIEDEYNFEYDQEAEENFNNYDILQLRLFFKKNGIKFIENFDSCIEAYNKPEILLNYFRGISIENYKDFRKIYYKKNCIAQFDIVNIILQDIQKRREQYLNWVMINAPMDYLFLRKLKEVDLCPIQLVYIQDADPLHKLFLSNILLSENIELVIWESFENVKKGSRFDAKANQKPYSQFLSQIENNSNMIYSEDKLLMEEFYEIINSEVDEEINEDVNFISHEQLLETIIPEIIERINQYIESYNKQWLIFKNEVSNKCKNFFDFSVINTKSKGTDLDKFKNLIEDTLYHIKKFNSNQAIEVPFLSSKSTPKVSIHNGDTSIYCPVKLTENKLILGSNKYRAIYKNKFYFMCSEDSYKTFISNPQKYSSYINPIIYYPKPKISILHSFGQSINKLTNELKTKLNFTVVEFFSMIQQIIPKNMPMLGQIFEEPTLKKFMDDYLIDDNFYFKNNITKIRKYIDMENSHLTDKDWLKMNSLFHQIEDNLCYINYPRKSTELMYLKENNISPDIIIHITSNPQEIHNKAKEIVTNNWLSYQASILEKIIEKDTITRQNYLKTRSEFFKNKLKEIDKIRNNDALKMRVNRMIKAIVLDAIKDPNIMLYDYFSTLDKIENIVDSQLPNPMYLLKKGFIDQFPTPSDNMIQRYLESENKEILNMKYFAEEFNIPWITLSDSKYYAEVLSILKNILIKNENIFENVFEVEFKTAEQMLSSGEVFLSKFGYWCPIQSYENNDFIQNYLVNDLNDTIYPIIHRKYVYYIHNVSNRTKFITHPLKYILQPFFQPPNISIRMAIVGPPKSGKSFYAKKLCEKFGFQLICVEKAIKAYLKMTSLIKNARLTLKILSQGDTLPDSVLVEIIKYAMQSTRAKVQGYIIDGYPITKTQFELFNKSGIIFHKIFNIIKSYEQCKHNMKYDDNLLRLSSKTKHDKWNNIFVGSFWLEDNFGNTTSLRDLSQLENETMKCVKSLREYHKNIHNNKACSLTDVPITKRERTEKMSLFLDICPVCKVKENRLTRPQSSLALKSNLIQYEMYFYWTCSKHTQKFIKDPKRFIEKTPHEPVLLPIETNLNKLMNNIFANSENFLKYCVVCALSCLWDPIYKQGKSNFLVTYSKYSFALCSLKCKTKFMERPFLYSQYKMHVCEPKIWESCHAQLSVSQLPLLGYLEQTIAGPSSLALKKLIAMKPLYPGLSETTSAMVFLGLCMGTWVQDDEIASYYKKLFNLYMESVQRFKMQVFKLKLLT